MSTIKALVKFDVLFLAVFIFSVLLIFYIHERGVLTGNLQLPSGYPGSAVFLFVAVIIMITLFNFLILAMSLKLFRDLKRRIVMSFISPLMFGIWFHMEGGFWTMGDLQFYIVIVIWMALFVSGPDFYIISSKKDWLLFILFLLLYYTIVLLWQYDIKAGQMVLNVFQFKIMLLGWIFLNCYLLFRHYKQASSVLFVRSLAHTNDGDRE